MAVRYRARFSFFCSRLISIANYITVLFEITHFFPSPYKLCLFSSDKICVCLHGDEARLNCMSSKAIQIIFFFAVSSIWDYNLTDLERVI